MTAPKLKNDVYVLVDYDNIPNRQKRKNMYSLLYKISECLAVHVYDESARCFLNVRLYGGWYEYKRLTRRAQDLIIDISKLSHSLVVPLQDGHFFKPTVRVGLAYSLGAKPHQHLFSTYRKRSGLDSSIYCVREPYNCKTPSCSLKVVQSVFSSMQCTNTGCSEKIGKVLNRNEQKLVDSMIVSDLIFYSCNMKCATCVVSADDDMWPGIITATSLGGEIFHVKPKPLGDSQKYYAPSEMKNYKQFVLGG